MLSTIRKLLSLFPRHYVGRFIGLFLLLLVGASLETFCVSLIFPVVTVLAYPEEALAAGYVARIHELLGRPSQIYFIYFVLLVLVIMYVVKNIYMAFLSLKQSRFAFLCLNLITDSLFSRYMLQPYAIHLRRNTGELLRNLTHEADRVIWSVLLPGFVLIVEALIALALITLLFMVDVLAAAIITSAFTFLGIIFYRALRDHSAVWGSRRQYHEGERIRKIQEGLGGLKEIRILGVAQNFLKEFTTHSQGRARYSSRHILAQGLPLLFLEVLAMCGILAIVAATQIQGKPLSFVLPVLGLFVGATFRLIPAANRIMMTVQELRFSKSAIDLVYDEIGPWTEPEAPLLSPDSISLSHEISLQNVWFSYPETNTPVLKDISLQIHQGTTIGFVGKTGAGKTTLIDVVLGLLQPDRGAVLVDGKDIGVNLSGWQALIGYIPQTIYLADASILENIAFGIPKDRIDQNKAWQALVSAQIAGFVESLPQGVETIVGENGIRLSGGEKQRLGIARALYRDPPILVLDEATAALDSTTEQDLMRAVDSLHGKKTILIIAHRTTTLRHCDLIVRLDDGVVTATGTYAQVIETVQ